MPMGRIDVRNQFQVLQLSEDEAAGCRAVVPTSAEASEEPPASSAASRLEDADKLGASEKTFLGLGVSGFRV